jgi:bifunctional DNA-binding transcriptional regulator/antitoxin component of YhaV-PrlF toxin-antitoxin module
MSNENKVWSIPVQEDKNGDAFIEFPPELIEQVGWKEGDRLKWTEQKDGSFVLEKKDTEMVLVETVSMFRIRYMVEVPKGKAEWALDTVTLNEAQEFSQVHLDETIVSHRVVSNEEALQLCDKDNEYAQSWPADKKIDIFFTTVK